MVVKMIRFFSSKFKKYKEASFDKPSYIESHYLDTSENAIIHIHLNTTADAFSQFCVKGHEELSLDFTDYLDAVIYHFPLRHPVILQFEIEHATAEQQNVLQKTIRGHYGLVLEDKKQDLRMNLLTMMGLFTFGAALLVFSYYLARNSKGQFITDLINIAGTFAIWETVDLYLLDRQNKKIEKLNAAQTATAQIIFSQPTKLEP